MKTTVWAVQFLLSNILELYVFRCLADFNFLTGIFLIGIDFALTLVGS